MRVFLGVDFGAPVVRQVLFIPYLPGIDIRVALGQYGQAHGIDVGVPRLILVLERHALGGGGDKGRRAHQVKHRAQFFSGQGAVQFIEGAELIIVFLGFQAIPVQIDPHPLQSKLFILLDLLVVLLGREPQKVRVHAEKILPDHAALRGQVHRLCIDFFTQQQGATHGD